MGNSGHLAHIHLRSQGAVASPPQDLTEAGGAVPWEQCTLCGPSFPATASLYLLAPLPLWNVGKETVRSQLFCEGPGTVGCHKPGCESLLCSNRLCDIGKSLELSEPHFFLLTLSVHGEVLVCRSPGPGAEGELWWDSHGQDLDADWSSLRGEARPPLDLPSSYDVLGKYIHHTSLSLSFSAHKNQRNLPLQGQLYRFTGRTEAPILWPPVVKSWLIGKDPDAGKDWGQRIKG